MTRNPDRAGSLRKVRVARLERVGAEAAGIVTVGLLLAAAFVAVAHAQDPAAPPSTPPVAADSAATAGTTQAPPADANAVSPPDAPPATPPAVEAPRSEAPKTEAAPAAPKTKRAVKRRPVTPSAKDLAGQPAAKPTAVKPAGTKPQVAKAPDGKTAAGAPAANAGAGTTESVAVRRLRAQAQAKATPTPVASIEERTTYQYNTLGRRDPFEAMVDNFVGDDVGGDAPPDVGGIQVVGIVWGADTFALVEDGRGNSLILRRGDKVMNGFVEKLERDAMVVKLTVDGQSQSVAIPLTRKGDQSNAKR